MFGTVFVGFDEFGAALMATSEELAPIFQKAAEAAAATIRRSAMDKAPHRTGTLQRSIIADTFPGGASVEVAELYGTYVEYGTGLYGPFKRRIFPKTARVLAWKQDGKAMFAASIKGMRAQPYFWPAVEEGQVFLTEQMSAGLDAVVAQLAGK